MSVAKTGTKMTSVITTMVTRYVRLEPKLYWQKALIARPMMDPTLVAFPHAACQLALATYVPSGWSSPKRFRNHGWPQ